MRITILCLILALTYNVNAEIKDDYKVNAILNTCLFKADIAQGTQIARQTEPQYNKMTSGNKVKFLFQDKEKWYVNKILKIHDMVWDRFSVQKSSSKVFVEVYNECVKETKEKLESLQPRQAQKEDFY